MKNLIILAFIFSTAQAQFKVKGTDKKIYVLDTTKTTITATLPLSAIYTSPNSINLSIDMPQAQSGYNFDSAIAVEVSKIKFSIDTNLIKAYVDIVLNARKSPVAKNQRIQTTLTGQKKFTFILPTSYVLFAEGKLLSLEKDYTQIGGEFTLKKAVKKGGIVRLLNLD